MAFAKPPLDWDEPNRLEALRALQLLDTPAEERFDRITSMAKEVFEVPIALVTLIDENRQWFKSRPGFDVAETSREISFCGHAILQEEIFIVENTLNDPRFAENPLVIGDPAIRFYAGKSLLAPDGKKIGTFCLIDHAPRRLDDAEQATLLSLASWVEREINLFSAAPDTLFRLENKLRLAHLLEYAIDGMISANFEGVIEAANPAVCEIFHFSVDELIGMNIQQLIPSREHSMHADFMTRLREGSSGETRTGLEVIGLRKNGKEFPLEISFRMFQTERRKFFTGIVRDITERKNAEHIKSEFIANVGHELRTPLTSICGSLEMLKEGFAGPLSDEVHQMVDIAYSSSQHLNSLVNDIIDVEKLDADIISFHKESCSIRQLIEETCKLTNPLEKKFNLTLSTQLPPEPISIHVDSSRFIQVLTNLVSNACKFSPAGKVVNIAVMRHLSWLRVNVVDQGPGVPEEFRSKIFQRFMQGQPPRNHGKTGAGLGLSLSKEMTEKMGGRIGYSSVAGQGATFFIEFPVLA